MKKLLTDIVLCCLLAVFLLTGCMSGDAEETSELNYWELSDYVRVSFSAHHTGFLNDKGDVLYYRHMQTGEPDIGHLEGSMKCYQWCPIGTNGSSIDSAAGEAYVPYSRYLKVATMCPMPKDCVGAFAAAFVQDGVEKKYISVRGEYEGHVKLCADGTAVLYGHNTDDLTVTYYMPQETEDEGRVYYELCGDAQELVDVEFFMGSKAGEIKTKGMAGNYTVTTYQEGVYENDGKPPYFPKERKAFCIKEYDKDGNLLSTTEEE